MSVFVLDRSGLPLMPCSEKRARKLLAAGRARVHRLVPFVIRLVDRRADSCAFHPLCIKLDPGSKATGLALVRDTENVDRTRLDKYGFPRGYLLRSKAVRGFQTGDLVRAAVPVSSKKAGVYGAAWLCAHRAVSTSRPVVKWCKVSRTNTAGLFSVAMATVTQG